MPKQEFLKLAAAELGFEPPKQSLRRAVETGVIKPGKFGRAYNFDKALLPAYCRWVRETTHIGRRFAAMQG